MSDQVLVSRSNGTTTITLNRPDKRNALSADMVESLIEAVAHANAHDRAIVFLGEGKFCAGFDFNGYEQLSDADLVLRFIRIEQLLQAVWYSPCVTAAFAEGACFGAGADLFASCHYRIAAPDTRFRMPGLRFGIVLGTRRLGELVGAQNAREILHTSRVLEVNEAREFGLVSEIIDPRQFETRRRELTDNADPLPVYSRRALMQETRLQLADSDLSALVRSAAQPGLRARIAAFLKPATK